MSCHRHFVMAHSALHRPRTRRTTFAISIRHFRRCRVDRFSPHARHTMMFGRFTIRACLITEQTHFPQLNTFSPRASSPRAHFSASFFTCLFTTTFNTGLTFHASSASSFLHAIIFSHIRRCACFVAHIDSIAHVAHAAHAFNASSSAAFFFSTLSSFIFLLRQPDFHFSIFAAFRYKSLPPHITRRLI